MSDFVWRFVSVVAVSVLAVAVPLAVGSVALLVAGLLLGGAVVLANILLWCTTEVSATVTFAALIFWVCLGSGLTLIKCPPSSSPSATR